MATTKARPRMPSSGYRSKYYDPAAAHKYYLSRRKLKGYKDRYKNSNRKRNKGADTEDETVDQRRRKKDDEQARLEEEREQETLLEEAEAEEEENDESARIVYSHKGDKRTGIHAARGWTVKDAQEVREAVSGRSGNVNQQLRENRENKQLNLIPDGYVLTQSEQDVVDRYQELSRRIRDMLATLDEAMAEVIEMQLDELDDKMKNLVAGIARKESEVGNPDKVSALRSKVERYNRAVGGLNG